MKRPAGDECKWGVQGLPSPKSTRSGTNLQYKLHKPPSTLNCRKNQGNVLSHCTFQLGCPTTQPKHHQAQDRLCSRILIHQDLSCLQRLSASRFIFLQLPAVGFSSLPAPLFLGTLYYCCSFRQFMNFLYFAFSLLPASSRKFGAMRILSRV